MNITLTDLQLIGIIAITLSVGILIGYYFPKEDS